MRLWRALLTHLATIREVHGCPKHRSLGIRLHVFDWGFGPDAVIRDDGLVLDSGGGWWMYCRFCGKGIWQ